MPATPAADERLLLGQDGRVAAADSKTVTVHRFDVPPGTEALVLRFDYAPRSCEDDSVNALLVGAGFERHIARRRATLTEGDLARLRRELDLEGRRRRLDNLMNVVLVDPEGRWRGRWDRNPSSASGDLVLGRKHASPGFLPGLIQPGRWAAAIECHGVFGPATVTYRLEVAARAALPVGGAERASAPTASSGSAGGPGLFLGEMHSHTFHSDGRHSLFELAAKVKALGGDFLALTDHNTMSGLAALPLEPLPIVLLAGCELTTFRGHYPVYGIREMVPWHVEGKVLPLEEIAPRVRAQGGLVGVAHPHFIGDPICTGCPAPAELSPASIDLMEVWYRRWDDPAADNEATLALWNNLWRRGHRVTGVAARDWHGAATDGRFPGDLPLTGVAAAALGAPALLEGLRRGAVIMTAGPLLDLAIEDGRGGRAGIGETLRTAAPATVVAAVSRLDGPATLRLYRSGELVRQAAVARDGVLDVPGLADRPGFYRAELWGEQLPLAITNHVVVAASARPSR